MFINKTEKAQLLIIAYKHLLLSSVIGGKLRHHMTGRGGPYGAVAWYVSGQELPWKVAVIWWWSGHDHL